MKTHDPARIASGWVCQRCGLLGGNATVAHFGNVGCVEHYSEQDDRIAALEAELEEAKARAERSEAAEHNTLVERNAAMLQAAKKIDALKADRDALAGALKRYGQHETTCGYSAQRGPIEDHDGSRETECTCGLDRALAEHGGQEVKDAPVDK